MTSFHTDKVPFNCKKSDSVLTHSGYKENCEEIWKAPGTYPYIPAKQIPANLQGTCSFFCCCTHLLIHCRTRFGQCQSQSAKRIKRRTRSIGSRRVPVTSFDHCCALVSLTSLRGKARNIFSSPTSRILAGVWTCVRVATVIHVFTP